MGYNVTNHKLTIIKAKTRWTASFLTTFIYPGTALKLFYMSIIISNSFLQIEFPLHTPCLNVALNNGFRASIMWIKIEKEEQGKSLVMHLSGSTVLALIVR